MRRRILKIQKDVMFLGQMAEPVMDLIFNDAQLYNRIRALLQKRAGIFKGEIE